MIIQTLHPNPPLTVVTATPLTREAFAPFGSVVSNPAPGQLPHNTPPPAVASLPCDAKSANQGSAIQYRDLGAVRNLYPAAAAAVATPRLTMFVCGARELQQQRPPVGSEEDGEKKEDSSSGNGNSSSSSSSSNGEAGGGGGGGGGFFEVKILERHPYTTQTFCPLGVDPNGARRYLVIVAPSIAPSPSRGSTAVDSDDDSAFLPPPPPASAGEEQGESDGLKRGFPALRNLRAFVAAGNQAVTYGAGTWHAPMVALGPVGSAIDFVVTQFANGVDLEDCQEVVLRGRGRRRSSGKDDGDDDDDSSGIWVQIPGDDSNNKSTRHSKL